jgi:sugar phosphate isomerase/epimerase
MERRNFIALMGALGLSHFNSNFAMANNELGITHLGACDWSLGQTARLGAFDVAKAIGLNGVQVSLGTLKDDMHLRQKSIQKLYKKKSKETGVRITSLAIGELNNTPYKSDPITDQWVYDSVDVAKKLDVNVVLLAFFAKNDLRNDPKGIETVIAKLKEVAPHAEKKGVTLGIESYLTAEEHLYIMEKVGSGAIKVYYDFRNAQDAGNDIYKEIKLLGNDQICEIHLKENGKFLGKGDVDWQQVSRALEEINFSQKKWRQIEWSLPKDTDYVSGHRQNLNYLKNLL